MEIKYFTPAVKPGNFYLEIPESQRTTGAAPHQWITLPEGIHTVQVVWQGDKATIVRFKRVGVTGNGRDILTMPGGMSSTPKTVPVVAPPGGVQIYVTLASVAEAGDVAAGKIVHAGLIVFVGTNELPA